ncbi:MAG: ankyrin repeat domain-containing protein [Verrucomicrobia bacterium]|nr:ankyrin repeat domain-containing protein [Verrucomicrobiota bacterium]
MLALLLILPCFGCSKSKEDLIKQLSTLNLQFNADDFVRCAAEGDQKALTLFLQAGFDPNAPNSANNTALMAAAERGRADIVKFLLDNKANPNVAGRDGATPLMVAAQNNQPEIVKLLLSRGADPNHQDNSGWTAVLKAAYQGHAKCIALLAAQSKLELDRALLVATLMERKDAVKTLLDNGAEVDTRASDGRTPLILASGKGNKELVQALLAAGADPSLTDRAGETPKTVAAAKGFSEIAELLSKAPAPTPSATAVAAASPTGSPQPSPSAISDADILQMPPPEGATSSGSPRQQQPATIGSTSMAQKISVEEVQEAFLPVTLAEVQGNKAVIKDADGSTYTVTVGDQLKGMSYRVVDIQARNVDDKDGNLVDASLVKLRHERTGQTISLIKGIPTREHGAYVVLLLNSTGQRIKVELDHDFSLPDQPSQRYRVLDIRPTQVVIKRVNDGEVWTLQKGGSDQ